MGDSLGDLREAARRADRDHTGCPAATGDPRHGSPGYIDRMLDGLKRFPGKVQFMLSGNDLTAQEFIELTRNDKRWKSVCDDVKISRMHIPDANHTFSSSNWRSQVSENTVSWIKGKVAHQGKQDS